MDETNVADVLDFQPLHYVDTFRRFLHQGDVGYYAYLNGKCCRRSWPQKGPKWVAINSFVQMKLGSNEGYIHYCETSPQARGKAVYPSVLNRIAEENTDLENIFICVDAENAPSVRGVEKAGFRERESRSEANSQDPVLPSLRVVLITQGVSPVVSRLLASRQKIVGIVQAAPRKSLASAEENGWKRIARSVGGFARRAARFLLRRPSLSLRALAKSEKIPYYYMGGGCDRSLEAWIRERNPDVIVVYSMSELLRKNIWSLPRLGTINLHPSLLPSYRGPNPFFAMYADMAPEGGVTVHYVDDGEDTGDILAQTSFPIPLGMRSSEFVRLSQELGAELMIEVLEKLARGATAGVRQPKTSPTPRARNLTIGKMWERIDWDSWPVERIFHCLRYLEPRLHEIESLKLPWYSRWEVADFTATSAKGTDDKNIRILSGKNGSISIKKASVFLRKL